MPGAGRERFPDGLPFMAHSPLLEEAEPRRYDACLGIEALVTLRMVEEAENACRRRDGRGYVPQSQAAAEELVFDSPAAFLGLAGVFAAAVGAVGGLVRAWRGKGCSADSLALHAVYGAAGLVPGALAASVALPVFRVLGRAGASALAGAVRDRRRSTPPAPPGAGGS